MTKKYKHSCGLYAVFHSERCQTPDHIDPRSGDFIDMDQWPEARNKGMNDLDMAAGEELEEKTENIEK